MIVVVRPMRPGEARLFLEIHHASVRGLAAKNYPAVVIDAWAPMPITDGAVELLQANHDNEIRLLAELDGEVVGLGVLVPQGSELRACYVLPTASRKGVGSAIVLEIERIAREHGLTRLQLDSSLGAESFYTALGYQVVERGEHAFRSGVRMAAVQMRKLLHATHP